MWAGLQLFNLKCEYQQAALLNHRKKPVQKANAMAENFFSILKAECINRQKTKDFSMAKSLIANYIDFYNHERIQLKTKLTPLEQRREFAA